MHRTECSANRYALRKIVMNRSDEIDDLLHRARNTRISHSELELPGQIVDFVQYSLVQAIR
ncbi:hypothetical protein WT12_19250 [Burkholderia territorii]|nr:hypothetical protein WT00_23300 [Burkholderia territorii]KVN45453.1 hypothetical protein WT12_19250 [Burkholderia territorii]